MGLGLGALGSGLTLRRFLQASDATVPASDLPSSSRSRRRGKLVVGEPYFTPGVPLVLDRRGSATSSPGDLAVVRTGRGRAQVERGARPGRRGSRPCSRRCSSSRARATLRAVRAARAEPRGPRRPARPADVHDRPRDGEGLRRRALVPARGRRDPRVGAHRRRLVLRPGRLAARPRRRRARALDLRARAASRRCCRTSSPTTSARCGRTRTGSASRSRSPPGRRAALLPLGDPLRRAADLRPGRAAAERAEPEIARGSSRWPTRLAPSCAAARFARGALRVETPEIAFRVRRPRRRRRRVARGRAARAHARRGADDPRERARRRRSSPAGAARRSTACTSGPTRSRSRCCSRSSPTSTCRRRPCPSGSRRRPAAELAGEISRARRRVRRAVRAAGGRRSRRSSCARSSRRATTREPRPLRPREPGVLPLHLADPPLPRPRRPPRAPARARRSPTTRPPSDLAALAEHTSAREREAAPDRVPRRRHLPRVAARGRACSSAAGSEPWEGEITGADRLGPLRPLRRGVRGLPAGAPAAAASSSS